MTSETVLHAKLWRVKGFQQRVDRIKFMSLKGLFWEMEEEESQISRVRVKKT